ncbi:MAG: ATP-binding protein [Candidatus Omnitrophica bacterium]|nr:ATP-binding protein [Candidatus Omnitrophota bacterium]MBU4590500.1 ATP-binding protein [Candidatus Omnitrophota bacterium]
MIIAVASGKGGTGKTTIATNLALSLKNVQLLDCDVEEPNSHIFIKPEIKTKVPSHIPVPEVDLGRCTFCGKCQEVCEYNAMAVLKDNVLVFSELCHGCGACSFLCPQKAIKEVKREIGVVEIGANGDLQFVHGRLNIGEAMSPPLIRAVKEYINPSKTVIIDAPPGTSCPVIESIKGSDFCILVTEPTPFGLNDLVLAVEVLRKLKIPFGVVINRSDLGNKDTYAYCKKEKIRILMEIPFKKEIAMAYSKGVPIVEELKEYKKEFTKMYEKIKS